MSFHRLAAIGFLGIVGVVCPALDPSFNLQGTLNTDAESGALDLSFPLGPGIGQNGLRYDPILFGHLALLNGKAGVIAAVTLAVKQLFNRWSVMLNAEAAGIKSGSRETPDKR